MSAIRSTRNLARLALPSALPQCSRTPGTSTISRNAWYSALPRPEFAHGFCPGTSRIARRYNSSQATSAKAVAQELKESATKLAERTMRRFWKTVSVAQHPQSGHLTVQLDKRSLRTPGGTTLLIPAERPLLAALVAHEWQEQDSILKPHTLPLTSLAARAIDGLHTQEAREKICADLLKYLETDTICFHEDHPPVLVRLQQERWDPILNWVRDRFSVEIKTFDGILGATQSTDTLSALGARLALMDGWTLAAFERAVMTTKSFMIALMLVDGHLSVEQASKAAEVEVASQIERWGEVEDTHDVDFQDVRRQLGSVAAMLVTTSPEHAKTVASVSS